MAMSAWALAICTLFPMALPTGAAAARRPLRVVLILERSVSMREDMAAAREAAAIFAGGLAQSGASLGLVVFGSSAIVAFPPRDPGHPEGGTGPAPDNLNASPGLPQLIRSVQSSASNAGLAEALWLGYQELAKQPVPGAANIIVLLTRGRPNGITAEFNEPDPNRNLLRGSSTCTNKSGAAPMRGVIAQTCGFRPKCGPANAVVGIRQPLNTAVDPSHPDVISWLTDPGSEPVIGPPASDGCAYRVDPGRVVEDIRGIPDRDSYGNSTAGEGYLESALYKKERIPLDLKAIRSPYQIGLASWNAADDAGRRIRQDTQLNVAIYAFALGPASAPPDEVLLGRIANVRSGDNSTYAPGRPSGLCVRVASATGLTAMMAEAARAVAARAQQQAAPRPSGDRRRQ